MVFVVALGTSAAFGLFSSATAPSQTNTFVAGQIVPATNFTAGSVSSTGATLSWTVPTQPAGATITNWTISQTPSGGAGCSGNQPSNPCTLTGLASGVDYTWTLTYFVGGWQAQTVTSATTQSSGGFSNIGSGTSRTSSGTSTVNYPTGTSAGDLVLLIIANGANQSSAPSPLSPWALVATAAVQNGNVGQQQMQMYWRVAGAETSVNVSFGTSSNGVVAWVIDYKGLPTPVALNGTAVSGTLSSSATLTPSTFTTTAANALVISVAYITSATATPVIPSLSTPNGFTQRVATSSTGITPAVGHGVGLGVADQVVPTAGPVTSPVWSGSTNNQWAFITAAFT